MSESEKRTTTTRKAGLYNLGAQLGAPAVAEAPEPEAPAAAPVQAAPEPEPEPEVVEAAAPARKVPVRKSTIAAPTAKAPARAPARGGRAADRGAAAWEGEHPQGGRGAAPVKSDGQARDVLADYAGPAWHPRAKDPTAQTSLELVEAIEVAHDEWTVANRARLTEHGMARPTNSGFREALLRLGLKHINDPEFIELIPPDARRKRR